LTEWKIDALLFLDFVKTFLIHFGNVDKKQVVIVVDLKMKFGVLGVGIFPDKESEKEHFFKTDLLTLLIDMTNLYGNEFVVDDFHVSLE
jgi:hypothetical protein